MLAVWASSKPILLQGHERSIPQIKYNGEGDLFSVAKGPNTWVRFQLQHHHVFRGRAVGLSVLHELVRPGVIHRSVLMGGGQEAMEVTTTSTRIGMFEARFFQAVYEEEFGRSQRSFWSH
ncbi:eukaryotic translation initiation factor 3 subunit I-like isoform X2 [Cynoglossus semilaevis]|uniref:eukaryotic translation initiation factor 3 subunit I-like isoform X2 n=1 Tax=Cynoglossus semilaevis TaxID=244447 RepID=UPI0007DC9C83|nr:eukaryotic translation initiation factor 3 subunit I-like isoform X2 [Cynoglossus semilaevis]